MRKFLMVILAVGAVAGFAAGIRHWGCSHYARHRHFEEHIAETCTQAAERVYDRHSRAPSNP